MGLGSSRRNLQFASAWLVCVAGWVVGHAASQGMDDHQWMAAGIAILGSVSLAAVAHAKPEPVRQDN